MKNIKKLINAVLICSFMFGVNYPIANASNSQSSIIITNNNTNNINSESIITTPNGGLNASDFKPQDNLPEKNYNSENWADDLYSVDDLLGGKSNVTMDDFEDTVLNKMLEIVSLMQTFTKPFCIILFILCALGILMSIVFDTKKQKAFILGLILSVITYVGVIFAPDIVLFFAGWLSF